MGIEQSRLEPSREVRWLVNRRDAVLSQESPRQKKGRMSKPRVEAMFDAKGVVHYKFVPEG